MLHRRSPLSVAALTSLALVAFSENQALAWGNEGHRLVCEIALDRLTPAGQAFLDSVRALRVRYRGSLRGLSELFTEPSKRRPHNVVSRKLHLP
jgi:hypothetical protein